VVARFRGDERRQAIWHGSVRGRPAVDGDYTFTVTVRDKAGNRAVAPTEIPTARIARPGTGVAVRHLTLQGPVTVVRPSAWVRLTVGPYRHRFRFSLTRLGSRRPITRGRRAGGRFRVRVPRRARTGVYLVEVSAGRRQAVWPLAVNGRPGGRGERPLVVLPVMTWQGLNTVDDDRDGFADTLDTSRSVRLDRPFARGRTPPRLASETAPLLRFLDRAKLPYDLTTDVSLARGGWLSGVPGVALAGSARWLPGALADRLRRFVEHGGRVVSFGGDALRRSVRLSATALSDPGPAHPENALRERTRLTRASPAPLSVEEDRLGLFGSRFLGEFSLFDLSAGLPGGTTRLDAAGRDPGKPALVAYRLGRGIVMRVGTPQWARGLTDPGVAQATRRVWALLQRG
jgi:hypothetical protein